MANTRRRVVMRVSDELHASITEAAAERGISVAQLLLTAVAVDVGYDLNLEGGKRGPGRPRLYASEDERVESRRNRRRATYQQERVLMNAIKTRLSVAEMQQLVKQLERKS